MTDEQLLPYIKRKYYIINNRVNHHQSYIKNGITNEFSGMDEFRTHCLNNGFKPDLVCHRPNREQPYSPRNLVFITKEEHLKISGKEKRKLNPIQVDEIKRLSETGVSTWKIAAKNQVSQPTAWKIIACKSYLN